MSTVPAHTVAFPSHEAESTLAPAGRALLDLDGTRVVPDSASSGEVAATSTSIRSTCTAYVGSHPCGRTDREESEGIGGLVVTGFANGSDLCDAAD
jgi:hypothetical protein